MSWRCLAQSEHGIARPRTVARTGRISAMWNRIPIQRCPGQVGVCYPLDCRPGLSGNIGLTLTRSRLSPKAKSRGSSWVERRSASGLLDDGFAPEADIDLGSADCGS